MGIKSDIISGAYSQLRISGITSQPTSEDMAIALNRLENMMAEWESRSLDVGYKFSDDPDANDDLGVERAHWHAIETNLAIRLIPDFNKDVPAALFSQATQSLSGLSAFVARERMRETQYPRRMPKGSGNTIRFSRFRRFNNQDDTPSNQPSNEIIFIGSIDDYSESYSAWLNAGESICKCSIEVSSGLELVSHEHGGDLIDYRLKVVGTVNDSIKQTVTITAESDSGRISKRVITFEMREAA